MLSLIKAILSSVLPWPLRRWLLVQVGGHVIHPSARVGFSVITARRIELGPHARIGHFNVIKQLSCLHLQQYASIGNLNWISGFPADDSSHYSDEENRVAELDLGEHAAVTSRHLIDCTNRVQIGKFSIIAGFRSTILTHSVDLKANRQRSGPVGIGDYCFVGTGATLLAGSGLPNYSVLAAGAVLIRAHKQVQMLYAGVPAEPVANLPADYNYFNRSKGYVT